MTKRLPLLRKWIVAVVGPVCGLSIWTTAAAVPSSKLTTRSMLISLVMIALSSRSSTSGVAASTGVADEALAASIAACNWSAGTPIKVEAYDGSITASSRPKSPALVHAIDCWTVSVTARTVCESAGCPVSIDGGLAIGVAAAAAAP